MSLVVRSALLGTMMGVMNMQGEPIEVAELGTVMAAMMGLSC